MSSANSDSFTSSWLNSLPFSCLISVCRTPNTILNKSGGTGHFCLTPDIRGKTFSFSLLSIWLNVNLSYMAFIMSKYVHAKHSLLRIFVANGC